MKNARAKWVVIGLIVLFALIQLIKPNETNPPVVASRSLEAHEQVPVEVQEILKRACYDCHSSSTVWPWYSHIAPISWYVAHDVNAARGHINFQDWEAQINPSGGKEHLGLICKLAREGRMPPADYRLMHKGTDLSVADVSAVCGWSQKYGSREDSDKKADR